MKPAFHTTYSVVLVSRHRHELGLMKYKGPEVLRLCHVLCFGIDINHVEARLILVHGVENDLKKEEEKNKLRFVLKTHDYSFKHILESHRW